MSPVDRSADQRLHSTLSNRVVAREPAGWSLHDALAACPAPWIEVHLGNVLDCPVTVLTGNRDALVSLDEAHAWAGHTTGPTDVVVRPGGHFYLAGRNEQVVEVIRQRLPAVTADDAPQHI
ncbi:thioesterase domain-containing protein [Micromonospora sp. CA-111912]|uniref:thioesterase II family protein n=1 Tax=Micromonospora sp. CA-111912 TaxID=3239955 RepID=UPI003D9172B0